MRLLTAEEVSKLFQLKTRQVKELARQGKIPAFKVGKLWRFPEDCILLTASYYETNETQKYE